MGFFDWLFGGKSKERAEILEEQKKKAELLEEEKKKVERQKKKAEILEEQKKKAELLEEEKKRVKLLWSYETGNTVWSVAIGDRYMAAGSGDKNVYLFDYSGKLLWSYETGNEVISVAIGDGYVAAGSKDKKVYLFDYSGNLLWSYETGSSVYSVAIRDGYVAAGGVDKKVYLFNYSGNLLWSYETGNWVNSIAIRDGYVAAGGVDKKVYLFNYSGNLLWSYETGNWVNSIAIENRYVAAGSDDNKVYLFDYSGKLLWRYGTGNYVYSVAIGNGYVAAGSKDNKVYLFDYSGKLLWSYETGSSVYSVAIRDGYVAAGSDDNKVYLFNYSGKLLWRYETGKYVKSVAIRDEYVAAGSGDSTLHVASNPSFIDNSIKSAESAIADAEKIGCNVTKPQEKLNKARSALSAGNYTKGITLVKSCIEELSDFNELNNQIKSAESAIADAEKIGCDVTKPQELLNKAISALSAGNYTEGITIAKSCIEEMKIRLSDFNDLNNQIKSAESAIADAEKIGCDVTKPQEILNKARSAHSAGNYTEGINLAKSCIEEMKGRLVDFNELNNQIKIAESAIADAEKIGCDVTKPQEILNKARSAHSAGNYSEGIALAKSCIEQAKRLKADARPEITIEFTNLNFRPNYWEKVDIILKNTGTAHAKAIGLRFSKEVEVKGLREVSLNIGYQERLSIMLMPKNAGDIPLEADIKYQDMLGKAYDTKTEFILNVGEAIREEISPKKIPAQLPEELAQDYHDIHLIGQGGFAKVFKAVREKDRKEVAIKIPIALDQATGRTFLQEIENWTRLNHPNIVKIYNHNILPIPFFEMELCDESLDEYIKQNQIDLKNAVWIIFNTAEGLKLAHSLKIIHIDLKPHNILLKDGVPKIADWGLSKVMTQSSSSKGGYTPHYAAPEQMSGKKKKDERTDIWGLGVILYQMTTGKLPFDGETPMEIMMDITTEDPVRPSELNPEIDSQLESVILKSLSKAPEDRYQSVKELQIDLAKYLQISLKEELFKSKSAKDVSKSAYYCADLFLVHLKINDGMNACKYIEDLIEYAKGDTKDGLINLRDGIEYRIEKKMDIPEDIVAQADILVHKIKIGRAG